MSVDPAPVSLLSDGRSFPGAAPQCREARWWTRALLRPFPDIADAVELVAGEFFANAVTHTRSGRPGGLVFVSLVALVGGVVHLEVVDQGQARTEARVKPPDPDRPGGRGLFIADALSHAWGRVPAEGDPLHGVFAAVPDGYDGPMVTWADFRTRSGPGPNPR
ncbi:ATP-binding protein [Actinorugispora endophytica]|uniref:Histidine kinase-like protein n=1 Tax=Actinorugispora endophytica TaxID=1605990 RepID=A0A4R6V4J1_9ACTN|nr:ATP-binding protein [Actinorugispora endophytica]TDQ55113.1 histidine kinase-like protein [Actinorugispora endophytica]